MSFWKKRSADVFQRYIALGDSISVDDYPGEGKGAASLLYKNPDDLYPEFSGKDLSSRCEGIHFKCLAQDGATSYDVLHSQLKHVPHSDSHRTAITVTAGGNDILALQCDAEEILLRLKAVVHQLLGRFRRSEIVLATIYDPTDGAGDLMEPDVPMEQEMNCLRRLNDSIREMSDPPRIRIADIHQQFLGHGKRSNDSNSRYYHPEDPSHWYMMDIEPNPRGAHEVRRLFWNAFFSTINRHERV
ncbi:MAG TPA: SGNH/GDSL hydrolase family protein [Acidobacteriota bacterium]|nr:SGNH/GDSL hydrolase family protein [Acidobacteriota bacterium]